MIWLLLILPVGAAAHVGDRLYQIPYVGDIAGEIQLDGRIDEWYELLGDPILTSLDFRGAISGSPPDPATLDFRIWLGWTSDPGRLYVAFVGTDDNYKNTHKSGRLISHNDSVLLGIDADHSGGDICFGCEWPDEIAEAFGRTQYYGAIARTETGQLIDSAPLVAGDNTWHIFPPYADAAGSVESEDPFISTIELYVTPFDRWANGADSQDAHEVSTLTAGKIIGFSIDVPDPDPQGESGGLYNMEGAGDSVAGMYADQLTDALLLGPEGTSVEAAAWGRIKAAVE